MNRSYWSITQSTAAKLIVVLSGVLFFITLSHLDTCLALLRHLGSIFRPILIGLALAYLLDPMARWLETKKVPRGWGVLASVLTALALTGLSLGIALPQLFRSIKALSSSVPFYFSQLQLLLEWAQANTGFDAGPLLEFMGSYVSLFNEALSFAASHLPQMLAYGRSLAGMLVHLFTGAILAVYILLEKANLQRQTRKLIWALCSRRVALRIFHVSRTAGHMLKGFIGGKVLDSAVVWLICLIAATVLNIPYASLFSLVVGVTNLVPVFGPIVGGVFCCLLLLVLNPMKAVLFAILVLVLQQVDGKIIGPMILGDATGLKTLWVLVAILVGGQVAGVPGMVLGVPFFATLYALGREFLDSCLDRKGIDYKGEPVAPGTAPDREAPAGREPQTPALFDEAFAAARRRHSSMEVALSLEEATLTDIWGEADADFYDEFLAIPVPEGDTASHEPPPPELSRVEGDEDMKIFTPPHRWSEEDGPAEEEFHLEDEEEPSVPGQEP